MAFKVSAPAALLLTALLLISLLLVLLLTRSGSRPCDVDTVDAEAVSLWHFTVGVTHPALRRYQIKDIRVGGESVRSLFTDIPRGNPGCRPEDFFCWPAGYLKREDIRLHIRGERLDALKRAILAHTGEPLEVLLRDEWDPFWTQVSRWNCEGTYEYSIRIPVKVEQTRCDEVTRLVYDRVVLPLLKKGEESQTTREADKRLNVNEMFDKLIADGEIESYLQKLSPTTNNPCVETIRLLKKIKEEKTDRFALGEYELSREIRGELKLILDAMAIDPGWSKSSLSLKVTGYTDEVEVDKVIGKELLTSKTGISQDVWAKIENPLEVYYGGYSDNTLLRDKVYVSLTAPEGGLRVEDRIYNNCQLGAVRAYVALVYLTSELGHVSRDDIYATGGIYSGQDVNNKSGDNPEKRRVHVEIILKAAKGEATNR